MNMNAPGNTPEVATTPVVKESAKDMMKRMLEDSHMKREEFQDLATKYEAEKTTIEAETKGQIEALLKTTVESMLNGGGIEINTDNQAVLKKYIKDIPEDILKRIEKGESVTLIMKEGKLVEKSIFDAFKRGLEGGTNISAKDSANLLKEPAQSAYAKLDGGKKEAFQSLVNQVSNNPDLGAAGGYADQALNLALGKTVDTGVKITNIQNEGDRQALVKVLNDITVPPVAPKVVPPATQADEKAVE